MIVFLMRAKRACFRFHFCGRSATLAIKRHYILPMYWLDEESGGVGGVDMLVGGDGVTPEAIGVCEAVVILEIG